MFVGISSDGRAAGILAQLEEHGGHTYFRGHISLCPRLYAASNDGSIPMLNGMRRGDYI